MWYGQVRDAVMVAVGISILAVMTYRNSYPPLGVIVALVCAGSVSASAALQYIVGRWERKP